MMKRFLHKKALITGASGGIGKAVTLQLAAEGAEVVIHYHDHKQEAEGVAGEIGKQGGSPVHLVEANLMNVHEAIQLGEKAWELMNGIDFLINNAGVSFKKHFLDTTVEDVDNFIDINFKGTLFLTQSVAKKMVAKQVEGSIYTITSINAIQPGVGLSAYGASKGALESLMKGVALELAPHGIKVNTLAIGAIQTEINKNVWENAEQLKSVNSNIPMGRMGQPDEIAAVVCALLAAGSYMTGSTIRVDGGWLLKNGFVAPKRYGNE